MLYFLSDFCVHLGLSHMYSLLKECGLWDMIQYVAGDDNDGCYLSSAFLPPLYDRRFWCRPATMCVLWGCSSNTYTFSPTAARRHNLLPFVTWESKSHHHMFYVMPLLIFECRAVQHCALFSNSPNLTPILPHQESVEYVPQESVPVPVSHLQPLAPWLFLQAGAGDMAFLHPALALHQLHLSKQVGII